MSEYSIDLAPLKSQLEQDLLLFGTCMVRRNEDGTVERIDPSEIFLWPNPAARVAATATDPKESCAPSVVSAPEAQEASGSSHPAPHEPDAIFKNPSSHRLWFYFLNQKEEGPVTERKFLEMLRQGLLPNSTAVFTEGMSYWMPAKAIPLFGPASVRAISLKDIK